MTKPFDPSRPCTTRDGRPVRILCTDAKADQPICALVTEKNGREYARYFRLDGGYMHHGEHGTEDLINVPTKRKGWIGVKPISTQGTLVANSSEVYQSEIAARAQEGRIFQQFIQIEFDE